MDNSQQQVSIEDFEELGSLQEELNSQSQRFSTLNRELAELKGNVLKKQAEVDIIKRFIKDLEQSIMCKKLEINMKPK